MTTVNSLFSGVTTSPARDFVAGIAARSGRSAYLLPCVGRCYAALEALVAKGVPPEKIWASDVSLFGAVIGHLADPSHRLADLGILLKGDYACFAEGAQSEADWAAGVFLAVKVAQLPTHNQFGANVRAELMTRRSHYRAQLRGRLEQLLDRISGIHYEMRDVCQVAALADDHPEAFCYVHLPDRAGGDTKTFAAAEAALAWNGPGAVAFDPADARTTLERLGGPDRLTLAYLGGSLGNMPDGWTPLLAQPVGEQTDYVVANALLGERYADSAARSKRPRILPIYNDEEITPQARVQLVKVDRDTCLYYRDLFVHRLGGANANIFYLVLLDGRVISALGTSLACLFAGQTPYLHEVFGISKSSDRYSRLGKLFMLLLTSGDMRRFLLATERAYTLRDLVGIQTTSITQHEEGKTDRSVMRVASREPLKGGGFRILYRADFRTDSWADCVQTWLKRWGHKKRG